MDNLQQQQHSGEENLTLNVTGMESRTSKQVQAAKSKYEEVLDTIKKSQVDYGNTSFVDNQEMQTKNKETYRQMSQKLVEFAQEMGIEIKGYSDFDEAEEKIVPDAEKAYNEAQGLTAKAKEAFNEENEKFTTAEAAYNNAKSRYDKSWFLGRIFGKLGTKLADAEEEKNAYERSKNKADDVLKLAQDHEAKMKKQFEDAPALKQSMYETRIQNMNGEQWQKKLLALSKAIEGEITKKIKDAENSVTTSKNEAERITGELRTTITEKKKKEEEVSKLDLSIKKKETDLGDLKEKSDEWYSLNNEINNLKNDKKDAQGQVDKYATMIEELHNADAINAASLNSLYDNKNMLYLQQDQLKNDIEHMKALIEITVTLMKLSQTSEVASNNANSNKVMTMKALQTNLKINQVALQTMTKTVTATGEQGENIEANITAATEEMKKEIAETQKQMDKFFNKGDKKK